MVLPALSLPNTSIHAPESATLLIVNEDETTINNTLKQKCNEIKLNKTTDFLIKLFEKTKQIIISKPVVKGPAGLTLTGTTHGVLSGTGPGHIKISSYQLYPDTNNPILPTTDKYLTFNPSNNNFIST